MLFGGDTRDVVLVRLNGFGSVHFDAHFLALLQQVIKLAFGVLTKSNASSIRKIEWLLRLVQIDKVANTHVSHRFNNTV